MEEIARPEFVLLIGLQASGKSTFYQQQLATTHTHISKDLLAHVKNPNARQQRLLEEALSQNKSVALDNTNPSLEVRAAVIATAKRFNAKCTGYYFESKVKDCLARNSLRVGKARVPDVALFSTIKKLALPSLEEGFDELFYVRMLPESGFQIDPWDSSL
jgi:predicted kinase